ncbi:MAG: CDP-alcohol phosphatidyltransferase family protein [Candidatus Saccharibacteria bacterium]|nr:CDP-alcohol phosphatidyltransferase family protein [Microbacteriaceae bacterium]
MTARSFCRALSDLSSAQKSKRGVSLYSRFVNRPIGRVLAAFCYRLGMSPNQVTVASGLITALGIVTMLAGPPHPARGIAVALLLVLGFALDSADGQVARLTGRGSAAGEWLDHVVDAAKIVSIHAAILIVAFRFFPVGGAWLLVPLGFQLVAIVTFFGGELERHLRPVSDVIVAPREPSALRAVALLPADYGVLAVSFSFLGWPWLFIVVYGLLFVSNLAIMLILLSKWFRALSVPPRKVA